MEANAKFPHGHRWLTDRIHAQGLCRAVVAPLRVAERSGLRRRTPPGCSGVPTARRSSSTRATIGRPCLRLDGAHPEVRQWLYDLARRVVRDWGYDYLKIDFLHWAPRARRLRRLTHAEAYRAPAAIRDGLGTEAFLLGCVRRCSTPLAWWTACASGRRGSQLGGIQEPARPLGCGASTIAPSG